MRCQPDLSGVANRGLLVCVNFKVKDNDGYPGTDTLWTPITRLSTIEEPLAMYVLHWSRGCGSFAPHAALNEVGASYELVEVDLDSNQEYTEEFLAINPRAQVPVLTLPDGTIMTESVAMMIHIADCHPESGLMPDIGQTDRAIAYRWLVFSAVNLYEAGCRIADTHHYSANKSDYEGIRAKARHDLDQYWEMVAEVIGDGPYILGRRYSVVDICLLMIAQWHPEPDALVERYPNLGKLCDAVKNRPAIEAIWNLNFL
jgi:glutathione S-transferase